ncbi:unnamed protein product [Trichobilharzia regenti]|nr:unnamed protein product [Trichobilharzia regenti]
MSSTVQIVIIHLLRPVLQDNKGYKVPCIFIDSDHMKRDRNNLRQQQQ